MSFSIIVAAQNIEKLVCAIAYTLKSSSGLARLTIVLASRRTQCFNICHRIVHIGLHRYHSAIAKHQEMLRDFQVCQIKRKLVLTHPNNR